MSWFDEDPIIEEISSPPAPGTGTRQRPKHPTTPADAPYESVEQRRAAAERQLMIRQQELDGAGPDDAKAIAREVQHIQASVPGVALPPPPQEQDIAFQTEDPVIQDASWMDEDQLLGASWWDTISAIPGTALGMLKQSVGGWMRSSGEQQLEQVEKLYGRPLTDEERTQLEGRAVTKFMREEGTELAAEGKEDVKEANPGELDFWKQSVLSGASSALITLPALAAGVLTRSPTIPLAAAGVLGYGQEYAEQRDAEIDPEKAHGHSLVAGAAEVATEFLPTKFMTQAVPGKVLKSMIAAIALDVPGELLNTTIQSVNAKYSRRPDMTWEEYGQDLLDTLGATMVAAPLQGGAAGVLSRATRGAGLPAESRAPEEEVALPEIEEPGDNGQLTQPSIDAETFAAESEQNAALIDQMNAVIPEDIGERELEESRKIVEEFENNKDAKPIAQADVHWPQLSTAPTDVVDVGELGATARQTENAEGYVNPNTGDRLDREFSFATDPDAVGLKPNQILPKPGVYVLGKPTEDRPAELLQPMMQTAEEWRKRWMPDATLVISNEQLFTDSALGWHYNMGPGKHLIVPAVLRKAKDLTRFNVNTQAGVFYNLSHEFGHALFNERLMDGIAPEIQGRLAKDSRAGIVASDTMTAITDPTTRAVLEEYNGIKSRIMAGEMKAQEFVDTWLGPAKRGRNYLKELGVDPSDTANAVMKAVVRRALNNSRIGNEMTKRQMREKLEGDFFSLEEYFAEQSARYAYTSKEDQKTPLGRYLKKGVDSLRRFFTGLKAEGVVAPGVKFSEWMEGLNQVGRLAEEAQQVSKTKKNAGKKAAVKAPVLPKATTKKSKAAPKRKVQKVEHNVKTEQSQKSRAQMARAQVMNLVRSGIVEKTDSQYDQLMDYINREEWDELTDYYQDLVGKTVKFEIEDSRRADRDDPDWQQQKFLSPKFKAWFGDWQNDPENASVVRVGVFSDSNDGILVVDKSSDAPPLVSFTSLARLKEGQNVFYASTVRGTHFTESFLPPPGDNDPTVVPVVLNIRNPLIVASPEESAGTTREELQRQGYDGIVYRNDLEGHVSFVVFSPDQIKLVPDRSPYDKFSGVQLELDHDAATPEGHNAGRFYRGVKNFLRDPGGMRKALRKVNSWGARTFLQIQQLAHLNPGISDLAFFSDKSMEYMRDRSSLIAASDRIVGEWNDLSQKNIDAVNKTLIEEMEGKEHWFNLTKGKKKLLSSPNPVDWYQYEMTEKAKEELKKRGIDMSTPQGEAVGKLLLSAKNDVMNLLNEAEQRMLENLGLRFGANQPVLMAEVRKLRKQFLDIRSVPFFPQARFGKYVLIVRKQKTNAQGMETVFQQHFEDETEWVNAFKRAKAKEAADEEVLHKELSDSQYVLMNLPGEFFDLATSELGLGQDQADQLAELLQPIKTDKVLSQFDNKRLGIKGYSQDSLRAYANWTGHFSNQISKMKYRKLLNLALMGMEKKIRIAQRTNPELLRKMSNVHKMMQEARDYMMAPPTEFQAIRAGVSIAYLWLNVKTASLNFFGLMTNYYNLQRKHGTLKGDKLFMQAVYNSFKVTNITSLNDIRQNNALDPQLQRAIDRATEEGVTTQSYAYHLAGVANAHLQFRKKELKPASKAWQKVVDLGMLPFRFTEISTRRIAFMAAMQEQLENKKISFDEQYRNAVREVAIMQNDYTLANRVRAMRGGKGIAEILPLATIFLSFAQHMSFHTLGGYELGERRKIEQQIKSGKLPESARPGKLSWSYGYTSRLWLLLFLLAGYEGMPFMENILDLLTGAWRQLGGKKPIRQELRELVRGLEQDPMTLSRGLMHNVAGYDLSRSVGQGRMLPGTEAAAFGGDVDLEKGLGGLMIDGLGVAGSVLKFAGAMISKGPEEGMLKAPGGVGNLYTAYYWTRYGVRGPNGAQLTTEDKDGKRVMRDLTAEEIAMKALGFNPTIVSQNREREFGKYEIKMYWRSLRSGFRERWVEADWKEDADEKQAIREAISDYNARVQDDKEFRKLRITPADIQEWSKNSARARRDMERGFDREKKTRGVLEDFSRSFEPPRGEP